VSRATLYVGDALEVLRTLPDESVQCCVTSPPYWGLRDYGVDGQLGLEPTPFLYVEDMVTVFQEVRRVLRDDGTLWLNLGSSYASSGGERTYGSYDGATGRGPGTRRNRVSGDSDPIQSHLLWRAPACGSDDKALLDSQAAGRACPDSDGESQDEIRTHRGRTVRNGQSAAQAEQQTSQTIRDSGRSDCDPTSPDASPLDVPLSTTPQSSVQRPDACGPGATVSACQPAMPTVSPASHSSAGTSACTSGTSSKSPPLVVRTQGKESFFSACGRSDCRGIGKCGICWCNLAIPSLNLKPKDLVSIPQLVAFALQADGWYLRSDIIWSKPNPMPESVTDRPTKAHEYVFLLTKSARYFYDADAIADELASDPKTWGRHNNKDPGECAVKPRPMFGPDRGGRDGTEWGNGATRNARTVWEIATKHYPNAHFATLPPELAARCIKAGSRPGDTVLDPFGGSGTTASVATGLGRNAIHIDLNPEYLDLAIERIGPLLVDVKEVTA